jgi:AcrR family transcriptional regulator
MGGDKEPIYHKIMKITKELIEKDGYYGVSLGDIAEQAKLNLQQVKEYFPEGKPAILRAIIEKNSLDILERVDFNIVTIENLAESLRFFLSLYLKKHWELAGFLREIERAYLVNKEHFKGFEDIFSFELSAAPMVAQVLKRFGFQQGRYFEDFVNLIIQTVDTLVHRHVIHGKLVPNDAVLIDYLISLSVGFIDYSIQFQNK